MPGRNQAKMKSVNWTKIRIEGLRIRRFNELRKEGLKFVVINRILQKEGFPPTIG